MRQVRVVLTSGKEFVIAATSFNFTGTGMLSIVREKSDGGEVLAAQFRSQEVSGVIWMDAIQSQA